MNRLTERSQEASHDAQTTGLRLGHTEVDGEHLLSALLAQSDGLVPRLVVAIGGDPGALRAAVEEDLSRRPTTSGPGAAPPGQVFVTQRLSRLLSTAEREAARLKDEYMSVEHLLLALADEGSATSAGRRLKEHGVTREAFLAALTRVRTTSGLRRRHRRSAMRRSRSAGTIGRALLAGDLPDGSVVHVDVRGGDLVVDHSPGVIAIST